MPERGPGPPALRDTKTPIHHAPTRPSYRTRGVLVDDRDLVTGPAELLGQQDPNAATPMMTTFIERSTWRLDLAVAVRDRGVRRRALGGA